MLALSFTVIFATGAIDDVFQLTPKQKLAGQVLAAFIACMGGLEKSASSSTRLPPARSCSDGSPTPLP